MDEDEAAAAPKELATLVYEIRSDASAPPVVIRQLPSMGLSFQVWPAASALCWYLEDKYGSRGGLSKLKIIELGSGPGLAGLLAARLGAQVLLTDLPQVIPNLVHNVEANMEDIRGSGGHARAQALRWGVQEDVEALGSSFDLVLASDVVYYDYLFDPLLQTLKWLLQAKRGEDSSAKRPSVMLAHLRRWKKDSRFFKQASKAFQVQVVHRHPAAENTRTGVVIYSLSARE